MANPKNIVQPSDLPVRKSHSQVVTVTYGTPVSIAGMTSRGEKDATPVHPGDMRAQVRQICENIGRALRSVGGNYPNVVKTTTFTTDVDEYHRVSDERYKYFKTDLPTSALIGVHSDASGSVYRKRQAALLDYLDAVFARTKDYLPPLRMPT
jgi:2-iminobutanoate/2-iminopropanoate deaminase